MFGVPLQWYADVLVWADSFTSLSLATIYIPYTTYYFVNHIFLHPWHFWAAAVYKTSRFRRQNLSSGDVRDNTQLDVSAKSWQYPPPSKLLGPQMTSSVLCLFIVFFQPFHSFLQWVETRKNVWKKDTNSNFCILDSALWDTLNYIL